MMDSDPAGAGRFRAILVLDTKPTARIYEYDVERAECPGEALYEAVSHWKCAEWDDSARGADCAIYAYRYLPGSRQPVDVVTYVGLLAEAPPHDLRRSREYSPN